MELLYRLVGVVGKLDRLGAVLMRAGLVLVTVWIGALKVTHYEAEGIVPFVANSPLFRWMLNDPGDYSKHRTPEGAVNAANESWHLANGTYTTSVILGIVIVTIGILIALGFKYPLYGVIGGLLLTGMSVTTLSFLITTPEVWVPAHGASTHGFPFLAAPGRLVVKDAIMLGASLWSAADSAKRFVAGRACCKNAKEPTKFTLRDRFAQRI
jgi:reactive chlorine resistance protein C